MNHQPQTVVVNHVHGINYLVNEKKVKASTTFVIPEVELTAQENYAVMKHVKLNKVRNICRSIYTF